MSEVRRIRDEHAARFDYDIEKIYMDLKEREKASGRKYSSYPARVARPVAVAQEESTNR
ncbi:MAG: hypothetical protein V3T83_03330 [Acidobacteriota bacterium]